MKLQTDHYHIISSDPKMKEIFQLIDKVASVDSTVIIYGESGTGKELIARALHLNSHKAKKPFITVNCGAIPEELMESELFGHEKGSFTGAIRTRIGRFEMANGGSIFLDEIGDMSPLLQVRLLRVLQNKSFERVGGGVTINVDVRVVAATHRNLEQEMGREKFREDLYYRLNVIPIHLPPLRERKSDIPILVKHFVNYFNKIMRKEINNIPEKTLKYLMDYDWPGNIRELENLMERLVILNGKGSISPEDLPGKILGKSIEKADTNQRELFTEDNSAAEDDSAVEAIVLRETFQPKFFVGIPDEGIDLKKMIENFEKDLIIEALDKTDWVKNKAASLLGLNRTTLVEKIKKLKLIRDMT